jgi:hypothetical protein
MTKIKSPRAKRNLRNEHPDATPASLTIDAHYARLNLPRLWNENRVDRLCSYLRITHVELASMLHLRGHIFMRQLKSPKAFSGPVCILLSVLEHKFMGDYASDTISNIFNFTADDKSRDT